MVEISKCIPKSYFRFFRKFNISFCRVERGVHCTANCIMLNATQTRNVNTLNAEDTSFTYNDSSGRDLLALIRHQ
jgi:hypothetical protein